MRVVGEVARGEGGCLHVLGIGAAITVSMRLGTGCRLSKGGEERERISGEVGGPVDARMLGGRAHGVGGDVKAIRPEGGGCARGTSFTVVKGAI